MSLRVTLAPRNFPVRAESAWQGAAFSYPVPPFSPSPIFQVSLLCLLSLYQDNSSSVGCSTRRHFPLPLFHSTHKIKTSQRRVEGRRGCVPPLASRVTGYPQGFAHPGENPEPRGFLACNKPRCDCLGLCQEPSGTFPGPGAPRA